MGLLIHWWVDCPWVVTVFVSFLYDVRRLHCSYDRVSNQHELEIANALLVFRSNKHIYAQVMDDSCSKTIISCSTLEPKSSASANSATFVLYTWYMVRKLKD